MRVTQCEFDALVSACGDNEAARDLVYATFSAQPTPQAGQLYRTPDGKSRLLVATRDGRQAVVNPDTGRLLVHGGEVFTNWAERIATDNYTLD
jgi:hypothetical protein